MLSETSQNVPKTETVVPDLMLLSGGDREYDVFDDANDVVVVIVLGSPTAKLDASNPPPPAEPEPIQPIRPLRDHAPSVATVLKEVWASYHNLPF